MALILPQPSQKYDATNEGQARAAIAREDGNNRKVGTDVEVGGSKLVLKSPNGNRWNITVSNAGVIAAVAL